MADQPALNATFFAFKRRERGGVLTGLTVAYLVLTVVVFGLFVLLNAQGIRDYADWYGSLISAGVSGSDPAAMEMMMPPASVMALGPAYLLLILVYYILFAAWEAGCLRWMIHGETQGLFGLSLGADTWRVWFGYWVWLLLLFAFYIVCAVVAGGVVFSLIAGAGGDASSAGPIAVLFAFLLFILILAGLLYFAVRFAPAAATSVARRKFAFFDAWTVSKGRFWALFGAFFLLILMFYVLYMVGVGGLVFSIFSTEQNQIGAAQPQSTQEAFDAFASPQLIAIVIGFIVVMTIAVMMLYVAMFGINARAAVAALEEGKIRAEA